MLGSYTISWQRFRPVQTCMLATSLRCSLHWISGDCTPPTTPVMGLSLHLPIQALSGEVGGGSGCTGRGNQPALESTRKGVARHLYL